MVLEKLLKCTGDSTEKKTQQDHSNLLLYSTACVPEVMCDGEAPANPNICHGSEWALIRIFMSFGWLVLLLVIGGGWKALWCFLATTHRLAQKTVDVLQICSKWAKQVWHILQKF